MIVLQPAPLGQVREHWRGIAVTVGVNWLVKPFSMALLGWLYGFYGNNGHARDFTCWSALAHTAKPLKLGKIPIYRAVENCANLSSTKSACPSGAGFFIAPLSEGSFTARFLGLAISSA